jgi:hypothetical protein
MFFFVLFKYTTKKFEPPKVQQKIPKVLSDSKTPEHSKILKNT